MPLITIKAFSGIKPLSDPILLSATDATVSNNTRLVSGALVPLAGTTTLKPLASILPKTIFRYGNSVVENEYWLEFANDVDIIRSPVIDEQFGRLYWADGEYPKYATNSMIVSGSVYPGSHYKLGIPAPVSSPSVQQNRILRKASYTVTKASIDNLSVGDVFLVSVDGGADVQLTLTAGTGGIVTPTSLASQLDAVAGISATVVGDDVKIESDSTESSATFTIKKRTSTETDFSDGAVTYTDFLSVSNGSDIVPTTTGTSGNPATYTFSGTDIANMFPGTVLLVYVNANPPVTCTVSAGANTSPSAVTADSLFNALSPISGIKVKVIDGAAKTVKVDTVLNGTSASLRIAKGTATTLASSAIEAIPIGTVFSVKINDNPYITTSPVRAGAGTSPAVVTPATLKDCLSTVPGLTVTLIEGTSRSLRLATSIATGTTSITIKTVTPGTKDIFTTVLTSTNTATYVVESRTYVYTYVSAFGEEGAPSNAPSPVNIDPDQPVTVTGMSTAPAGAYNITHKRIYRSSAVGANAEFQFVAEIPVTQTSYTDSFKQADLGEVLPSEDWLPPPAELKGLKLTAMGFACGFVGNTVYLSEPNLPHAWPHQYPVDYQIVGLGVFRQSIVVLTTGLPYILSGVDPGAMTLDRLEKPLACVSKRSIVDTEDGVLYASSSGLVSVGAGGIDVISRTLIDRKGWQEYNPSSMIAFAHDNRYVACFTKADNSRGMLLFDFSGQGAAMTTCDINSSTEITGGYVDARTDTLYFAQGSNIVRFNAGTPLTYTWRSKLFRLPYAMNFTAGLLRAKAYPVTLKVFADGVLRHTQTVTDDLVFRLPSGWRAVDWQLEVTGTNDVTDVSIATSVEEIKAT